MINEKNISEPMAPQFSEKHNDKMEKYNEKLEKHDKKINKYDGKKMIENLKALRTNMRINTDSGYYKKAYEIYQEIKKRFLESDVQLPEQCEDIMQEREFEEEVNQTLIQYYLKQVRVYMERSENDLKVPEFRSFDRNFKRLTDTINTLHKQGYNTAKLLKKRDSIRNKCQKLRKKFIAKYRDQKTQLKPREESRTESEPQSQPNPSERLTNSTKSAPFKRNSHPQSISDSQPNSDLDSQPNSDLDSQPNSDLDSQSESNLSRDIEGDKQELEEVLNFSNGGDESPYTAHNTKNNPHAPPKTLLIKDKGSFIGKGRNKGNIEDDLTFARKSVDSKSNEEDERDKDHRKKGSKTKRKIQKEIDRRLYKQMGTTTLKVFTKEGYKRIKVGPETPAGKALYHAFNRIFYRIMETPKQNGHRNAPPILHLCFLKFAPLNHPIDSPRMNQYESNLPKPLNQTILTRYFLGPYRRYVPMVNAIKEGTRTHLSSTPLKSKHKSKSRSNINHSAAEHTRKAILDILDKIFSKISYKGSLSRIKINGRQMEISFSALTLLKHTPKNREILPMRLTGIPKAGYYFLTAGEELEVDLTQFCRYISGKLEAYQTQIRDQRQRILMNGKMDQIYTFQKRLNLGSMAIFTLASGLAFWIGGLVPLIIGGLGGGLWLASTLYGLIQRRKVRRTAITPAHNMCPGKELVKEIEKSLRLINAEYAKLFVKEINVPLGMKKAKKRLKNHKKEKQKIHKKEQNKACITKEAEKSTPTSMSKNKTKTKHKSSLAPSDVKRTNIEAFLKK